GAAAILTLVAVKLPSLLPRHASETDNRAPSSHQNIDALQPMNENEHRTAPGGANLSIGVGSRRPSVPQSHGISQPAPREVESRLDTPEPTPPSGDEEP